MVDWQPLLEGSVDGLSLAVGGVCVGDPVRALPYKDITQVMPNTPKVRRERGWKEPTDRATSEWVRHARVMALLRAFELGSPQDFAAGGC